LFFLFETLNLFGKEETGGTKIELEISTVAMHVV